MRMRKPIPVQEIREAARRIQGLALRTPLLPLNIEAAPAEIYLKLECLQPIGSFKLRGAGNAVASVPPESLAQGVYTASAGNMAQGLAWNAQRLGIQCTAVVPDHAPQTKLDAIQRLGANIIRVPFERWWRIIEEHTYEPLAGQVFIHPVSDDRVMAGNGTIGLEILEDLPGVDAVLIPYGGGGLSAGIASAVKAMRPETRVYGCEVDTAAPLDAAFRAGQPISVPYTPSFVDGIGSGSVLADMWPAVQTLLDDALVVSLVQVAAAIRILVARNRMVAEGAGATPVAAALAGLGGSGKVVCVVSGGNIDSHKLAKILMGEVP